MSLHEKLSIFIKSPDFNEIKDIKEIRDFMPDFKRESHTVWCTSIIKSPDFNQIKEITDFSVLVMIKAS